MKQLQLIRPIVFFDLETTGTDPQRDRIVEIAAVRLDPDGSTEERDRRINPERPIPEEATAVHGIGDDDVKDAPTFRDVARGLMQFIGDADLAGFNVRRFDVPLLERELADCGMNLQLGSRKIVDVMTIFHRKERRDLSAAVQFYLSRDHEGAHGALADVRATVDVLRAQLGRYDDLPATVDALDGWTRPRPDGVDREGKFVLRSGRVLVAFGKHRGRALDEMVREEPDYLQWILGSDFPDDAKQLVRRALAGEELPLGPDPRGGQSA